MNQEVVLVTGCSTGLGRNICMMLINAGYIVISSARNVNSIMDIPADMNLELDVTNNKSINSAITKIIDKYGRIDMLINNAGYSVRGAIEEIDIQKTKDMFEVNVYGIIRMIQAVALHMREQKSGKIINIGSISGQFTAIANGGYCASKHAVEAINDAARLELMNFGVQVSVIEPGAIETNFFKTLSKNSDNIMINKKSPYYSFYQHDLNYRKNQKRTEVSEAAKQIFNIVKKKKLKARYKIGVPFYFSILLKLSDSTKEKLILHFT